MSGWLPEPGVTEWLQYLAKYAAEDLSGFLSIFFVILTPLLIVSAYFAYQLVKQEEKKMKKREQKEKLVAKAKKRLNKQS